MAHVSLNVIHADLEILKQDVADLKNALLGDDGKLSSWAKKRIAAYLKKAPRAVVSQAEVEKEFL